MTPTGPPSSSTRKHNLWRLFGLHHDPFSLLNNSLLAPGLESTLVNLGGASSNAIVSSSSQDYQQRYGYGNNNNIPCPYVVSKEVKLPVVAAKKDRHSKICTAQGFRDRRVRLSINVAREFFDLQDLLGFDRASKTLEWLLSNSRNAIKDLENSKCINSTSLSSSSECDDVLDKNKKEATERMRKMKEAAAIMTRESRAKARARARERTREKMCSTIRVLSNCQAEFHESVALKRKLM